MPAEASPAAAGGDERLLSGWGRSALSRARVLVPHDAAAVPGLLAAAPARGLVARGLGRSYGDAAQNAGGAVVDTTRLAGVLNLDEARGVARLAAGTSLDLLLRTLVPRGWFPPVTPGTRFVTCGGAVAADIHGKNHHRDGSFCAHVVELDLETPAAGRLRLSPTGDPQAFWATAGGMGLTGVVVALALRLQRVETARMRVDTERARDLDDTMSRMLATDDAYQYSVAWIDPLATGGRLGRAVLTRGNHARLADLPLRERADARSVAQPRAVRAPGWVPGGLLNRLTVAAFNELWFRKAPACERDALTSLEAFFYPLDGVAGWNRLYGSRGFVQYQFVVPYGQEDALRRIFERLSGARCPSFLAVLKRFGDATPGPLSFALPGWTLALDIPAGRAGLGELLDELDRHVVDAGGRVYLAKDARVRPELVPVMYPRLPEWRAVRARLDPDAVLQSDLGRRLGLLR